MLRADELLGVIIIYRHEVRPFTDSQIALMETFADQAAIAIENARLLTELQAKNADLTEALEQQTATSEILRVICSSPTDVQPVFDTIARARGQAVRAPTISVVFRFDGELVHLVALHGVTPEGSRRCGASSRCRRAARRVDGPCGPGPGGRARSPDVRGRSRVPSTAHGAGQRATASCLGVPMLREGRPSA